MLFNILYYLNKYNLKIYISKFISNEDFKSKIKKKIKIDKDLKPEKFNSSQDLLKALKKKSYYCILYYKLMPKICKNAELNENFKKSILHKDKITIIFNENDKIAFFNNSTGFIDKSLLIENSNPDIMENGPVNNIKFKDDIKILIRLFYNYRFLKEKDNKEFNLLVEDNSESIYLINNNWIEKYKSFFEYDDLKEYLKKLNKNDKLYSTSFDIISDEYIKNIISNLPEDYINKLKTKNKFEIKEKFDKYDTDIIKGIRDDKKIEISYLIKNQIINQEIYTALINKGYGKSSQLKNCELYFIGEQKILLLNKISINKDKDVIGYINEENNFVPEYILDYNNIQLSQLNHFLQNSFKSFCSETTKECCNLYDVDNKSKIGKCYRVNKALNEDKANISNDLKKSKNITNVPLDKTQKDVQKYIELFFQIYLFYEKIKNQINQNLIKSKIEHYYIIKKKWMNKFFEYLEYNKFIEYINKGNIDDIINKYKNNNSQYIVEITNLLNNSYTKNLKAKIENKDEFNKINKVEYYELKIKEKTLIPNKTIYY